MSLPNDKQLLRRLKRGDKESFNELFEIRYTRYLTFAKRLLHDATAAEDVVQSGGKLDCVKLREVEE